MNNDLISVIIPVYNVEKYLNKCVESVVKQTYNNLEIILVDDGSTDMSGNMCDEWVNKDERIKTIHKDNGGLSSARNEGIAIAKGKYIGFVDSDDWIAEDMYERLYSLIKKGDYGFSFCRIQRTNEILEEDDEVIIYDSKTFIKSLLKVGTQDSDQYAVDKLYKRELLDEKQYPVGLTDEDVEGTFKVALKVKQIIGTKKVGYYYRVDNEDSLTAPVFNQHRMDYLEICDHVLALANKNGDCDIINWAEQFRRRATFGVLSRIAVMQIADDMKNDIEDIKKTLLSDLRRDYFQLVISDMPISRKILLTAYCIDYNLCERCLKHKNVKLK